MTKKVNSDCYLIFQNEKQLIFLSDSFIFHSEKVSNFYNELMMTNDELMTSFQIRTENYNEVQRLLSEINQILFRAQRLRGKRPFRMTKLMRCLFHVSIFCLQTFSRKHSDEDDDELQRSTGTEKYRETCSDHADLDEKKWNKIF